MISVDTFKLFTKISDVLATFQNSGMYSRH